MHLDAVSSILMSQTAALGGLGIAPLQSLLTSLAVLDHRSSPELLDAIAGMVTANTSQLLAPRQLLTVAGSYAQLGHAHRPLAHALAARMLELAPQWTAEHAEDIACLAGALAGMGGDEPKATAAALRFAGGHAVRLSPAALVKGMRAAMSASPARVGKSTSSSVSAILEASAGTSSAAAGIKSRADTPARAACSLASLEFVRSASVQLRHDVHSLGLPELACVVSACSHVGHTDTPLLDGLASSLADRLSIPGTAGEGGQQTVVMGSGASAAEGPAVVEASAEAAAHLVEVLKVRL